MTAVRACLVGLGLLLGMAPGLRAQASGPPMSDTVSTAAADTSGLFDLDDAPVPDPARYSIAGIPLDTVEMAPPPVPRVALDHLRADPKYRYTGRAGARGPTLLERLWNWFMRTYLGPAGDAVFSKPGRTVLVVVAFALLIGLVVRLVRVGGGGLFGRRDRAMGEAGDVLLDTDRIEDVDLAALLARARAEGRFRDATRFRYLLGLQRLAAEGVVVWDRHKTDGDYLREVRRQARPALTAAFAQAARAFAWVWYGEAPLDAARFARVERTLDGLDAALAATVSSPVEAP